MIRAAVQQTTARNEDCTELNRVIGMLTPDSAGAAHVEQPAWSPALPRAPAQDGWPAPAAKAEPPTE
eukprot:14070490-Heterocapsa_arctica.AAC.1